MSKLNVEVSDPVVIAARKFAVDKYGSSRGIGKIVEDALRDYLAKNDVQIPELNAKNSESIGNPLKALTLTASAA